MDSVVPDYILESVHSLPPLPAATSRLLTLARDPDADFREVARVIQLDQTLTARVLRAANSAIYGLSRQVQTVHQATVLLGRDAVINLALGVSMMNLQNNIMQNRWPMDAGTFWQHSIAVALLARKLAKHLNLEDAEGAFVAGLIHDIGKMVMLDHFGDLYAQVILAAQYGTKPLHHLEHDILDINHAVVGQALCLHWKLPSALTRAVAEHHDEQPSAPRTLAEVVRNANDLVKMMHLGNSGNRFAEVQPSQHLPHRQLTLAGLHALINDLPGELLEAAALFASTAGDAGAPSGASNRPTIHLHVHAPEEREMLTIMLWSMGYDVAVLQESMPDTLDVSSSGLITAFPLTHTGETQSRMNELPVLNYAAWRTNEDVLQEGQVNVHAVRTWLEEYFPRPCPLSPVS